ncbi:MAG: uroporphyrinogen-III C-methyltransferase [Succinivibrio sp.]|nr:uroporphyrinogen-III C-methyltransferase [Succinivibrio sp.]
MQTTSNDKEALSKAQLKANLHAEEIAIEEQAAQIRKEAQIKAQDKSAKEQETTTTGKAPADDVPSMPIVEKTGADESEKDTAAPEDTKDAETEAKDTPEASAKAEPEVKAPSPEPPKVEVAPAVVAPQYVPNNAINAHIEQELASIRRRTGSMTFLFFLFLILIGAGIFFAATHPDKVPFLQAQTQAPAIDPVKLAQVYTDMDRVKDELSEVRKLNTSNQQLQGALKDLATEFTNYKSTQGENTKRLLSLADQLRDYELRDPDDWRVAQAYFLVNNAFLMAVLNHDAKSAIWCLKDADGLLVNLEDEEIIKVREAISHDVMALSSLPDIDIRGIIFKLDSVYNNIPKMALNDMSSSEQLQSLLQKKNQATGNIADWKNNLLASLTDFSSRFVEVRRRTDPMVNTFLSPDQANILQQNVQSEILIAKFSAINQNDQGFTNNLAQVIKLIEQYYDHNTDTYKANVAALNELKGMRVSSNMPSVLKSYVMFKDYADSRLKLMNKTKAAAQPVAAAKPLQVSTPSPAPAPATASAPAKSQSNQKHAGAK